MDNKLLEKWFQVAPAELFHVIPSPEQLLNFGFIKGCNNFDALGGLVYDCLFGYVDLAIEDYKTLPDAPTDKEIFSDKDKESMSTFFV